MKIPDIIDIAYKVIKAFEKIGIVYHIGGSLASSAFGIPVLHWMQISWPIINRTGI